MISLLSAAYDSGMNEERRKHQQCKINFGFSVDLLGLFVGLFVASSEMRKDTA